MKKYLVYYTEKIKGRPIPIHHTAMEYSDSKKEIREYYKLLKYKITSIEEIKE